MTDDELSSFSRKERQQIAQKLRDYIEPDRMTYDELCEILRRNA